MAVKRVCVHAHVYQVNSWKDSKLSFWQAYFLEVITRLFSHWPVYQARASITACDIAEGSFWPKTWYRADMCMPCDDLFIIWSKLPIRQRINYFICHNSLLEYAKSNWRRTDRLLRCLYRSPLHITSHPQPSASDYASQSPTLYALQIHLLTYLLIQR